MSTIREFEKNLEREERFRLNLGLKIEELPEVYIPEEEKFEAFYPILEEFKKRKSSKTVKWNMKYKPLLHKAYRALKK